MSFFHAIFLGLIQGVSEFLPISSSGHLIIIPKLIGISGQSLYFDLILHLGTTFAVVIYFFKDLTTIFFTLLRDLIKHLGNFKKYSGVSILGLKIIAGSVPAAVLGVLLDNYIENIFRNISYVVVFLFIGTVLLILAEYKLRKIGNAENIPSENNDIDNDTLNTKISFKNSLLIGLFQSFAIFPGVSRSGSTISGGVFLDLTRAQAAKYSFLLSVPIIAGAAFYKIVSSIGGPGLIFDGSLVIGFISSFIFGLFAIRFLLDFLGKNKLDIFIIYRLILIVVLLLLK